MPLFSKTISRRRSRLIVRVIGFALILGATRSAVQAASTINILETGSSMLYPLFNLWIPVFGKTSPNVQITTQSTGSGTGISQADAGIAQIGASDAYLSDALERENPNMLNIPLAISMQMVNYNLPGLNKQHLKLSGPVLAGIYEGKIQKWNDNQIAALNPGVKLPDHAIITLHRTDGSGDTFIFMQYLTFSSPEWKNNLNYGTTVSWPAVPGGLGAEGNPGMLTATKDNPYSIAYIGTSYQDAVEKDGLGIAMLENHDGNFLLPTSETADAAATVMAAQTPATERISLIFAPGANSYPIINYEYAIVNRKQHEAEVATALRGFFTWAISRDGGSSPHFMQEVHFVALPAAVAKLSAAQIAQIQ